MFKVEVDVGQTKHMTRKPHDKASEARTGNGKAREDHDRIVPKNDMAELDKEASQHVVAQTFVIKLSGQDAVRTLLVIVR